MPQNAPKENPAEVKEQTPEEKAQKLMETIKNSKEDSGKIFAWLELSKLKDQLKQQPEQNKDILNTLAELDKTKPLDDARMAWWMNQADEAAKKSKEKKET